MISPPPFPELLVHNFSPRVVPPNGSGSSQIMLVGEASGRHETDALIPFHPKADAGSVLARVMRRAGVSRDSFTLTNTCWMRPPNNELEGCSYEQLAIDLFRPYNDALIAERAPKVIITYGNVALKSFTPYGRTDSTSISHLQGYILPGPHSSLLLPQLHPSFILHGQARFTEALIWGMLRAHELVRDGLRPQPTRYVTTPTLDDLLQFERGFNPDFHFLAFDIETPESDKLNEEEVEDKEEDISYNIIRMSLCYDGENGYSASFPFNSPFKEVALRMLGRAKRLEVWNNYFDVPRLKAAGTIFNGRIYDRMQSWHFLHPTLPASLEFATPLLGWSLPPWKFISADQPEEYSAIDAHALRSNGIAIEKALRERGVFDLHERHVVDCYEVLTKMSENGLPFDQPAAKEFQIKLERLKEEREAELQRRVPEELKPPKQKFGLKKVPKVTEGLVRRKFHVASIDMTHQEHLDFTNLHDATLPVSDQMTVLVERWCLLEPFLPTSPKQIGALIKHFGHKLGTNRKTKKETTDDETLRKLIRKCLDSARPKDRELGELLKMSRECRQLSKVLGTYVKGWVPGKDGRVHALPGYWGKMMRISWRRPNLAGTVADKQEEMISAGFRKCIKAAPGKVLVDADWKGIEAVIVGYLAGDQDYIRLAKIGVHDYFCAHILVSKGKLPLSDIPSLALPDSDLKVIFRNIKKHFPKDRDDSKHIIHGTAYCMTPPLMSSLYELPLAEAERLQGLYFDLFPKIKSWQESVKSLAHRSVYLTNPFGYQMPFWEVYRWNSQRYERLLTIWRKPQSYQANGLRYNLTRNEQEWYGKIKEFVDSGMKVEDAISKLSYDLGDDAKSAVSFLPRDTAAAMLKEALLQLRHLAEEGIMLACAHDAVTCEDYERNVDVIAGELKRVMESPVPQLGGLVVNVEIAVGPTWEKDAMEVWEPASLPATPLLTSSPA